MIFNIFGIKYDQTQTLRKGAGKFPKMFKEELSRAETFINGVDLSEKMFVDRFEMLIPRDMRELNKMVEARLSKASHFPLIIGGEHTISYYSLKSLLRRKKIDYAVVLDAHADCESSLGHEGVVRRIARKIGEENVYLLGLRTMSKGEKEYLENSKINVYPDITRGISAVSGLEGRIYLSVDFDVLDPCFLPLVGNPEPGGVGWKDALALVSSVADRIVAIDFVEFTPMGIREIDRVYSHLATKFILACAAEIIKSAEK